MGCKVLVIWQNVHVRVKSRTLRMFGILNIFKPAGVTSRDCVNVVQKLVRPEKVGHAGTLDPMATGVLIVAVGQAVRLVDWIHELPKAYIGRFELGKRSESADTESPIEVVVGCPIPNEEELRTSLSKFTGLIRQTPPTFSAVKIGGKRAYNMARKGVEFEVPDREVMVHRIELARYESPFFELEVECGTGTFMRSLGRDLARSVQSEAIMCSLIRTSVGPFMAEQAVELKSLSCREDVERHLQEPGKAIPHVPRVQLDAPQLERIKRGQSIHIEDSFPHDREIAAFDEHNQLCSLLAYRSNGHWGPYRNFVI